MIVNYTRPEEQEENKGVEESGSMVEEVHGVKIYGGGIRGIKALKQHRKKPDEGAEEEKVEEQSTDVSGNRTLDRFERRMSKPKRRIF